MQTVIQVSLSGHSTSFQLEESAYTALRSYLDGARSRLRRDPDREEILCDLEQSIGEKLGRLVGSEQRIINRKEVDAVLDQVGAVDAGNGESGAGAATFGRPRRLCRIEEGKWVAGVCQGLAAYSSIGVEWVRAIFVVVSVFTGGIPLLIYLALMFMLPVVRTHDEYNASLATHSGAV